MKNVTVFAILCMAFLSPCYSLAQIQRCLTFESSQDFKLKHPGAETDEQFEGWLQKKKAFKSQLNARTLAGTYTIPIIFHIVHNGEAIGTGSNISAAQIQAQLDQLNKDFANQSGSSYTIAADMGIQFCLAVVGKDGKALAEPGIERINRNSKGWLAPPYDASTSDSYVDEVIMPNTIWDPYQYFNIWVLSIDTRYLIGKATFPTSSLPGILTNETDTHAGVMVDYGTVGSVVKPGAYGAGYGMGRTLTHEMGHAFGLRHIWGDAACGNDYCDDTPPQSKQTEGCPAAGTLNDCSPLVPKMFENYMDYTSDNCVNTFTADQKTRMQVVVQNSPRRKELLNAATCIVPAANAIRFSHTTGAVTETAAVTTICPRYRDVLVNISVYEAASGDATLTFTNSGTSREGTDFLMIPSSVSFTSGDGATKQVTIRILDDGAVEPLENIVLNYTIEGSGVTTGMGAQTFTLDIMDDDKVPVINANSSYALLNESFGTSGGAFPSGWMWGSFLPAPVNRWVVSTNGGVGFSGQSAHITNNTTTRPNVYSLDSESDVILITKAITAEGYANLQLSFKYTCNGEVANGYLYDYGTLLYSFDGTNFYILPNEPQNRSEYLFYGTTTPTTFSQPLPAFLNNATFYLGFEWYNDPADGSGQGFTIDDVVVTGAALQVESRATQTGVQTIFTQQEVYITNTANDAVIARISNPTRDIGCITATVSQAGTGTATVSTTMGSFIRTQKVIQLSPALPDATTEYDVTLYFTEAELAAWSANKDKLKILKVKDGVALNKTLTSAQAEVITPTKVEIKTNEGYIAYTGHFAGFSQFMLVSPNFVLPVQFTDFRARPAEKSIELAWTTAGEKENKGFAVERSTDGSLFSAIGWVNGSSTSSKPHSYTYTDHQVLPNLTYYYRLQQVDHDGAYQYSEVRQARITGSGIIVKALPNPVHDYLKVLIGGTTTPAGIKLLDARGQVVGQWSNIKAATHAFEIPMGHLPAGIYSLVVIGPDGIRTQKVIKQ